MAATISTGNWYLVTYSVDVNGATVYLNGGTAAGGSQATISYTGTGTPLLENGSTFATIGNQGQGGGFSAATQFLGEIDDVQIYNTALTDAQVQQLYSLVPVGVTLNSNTATSLGSNAQLSVGAGSTFNVAVSQQVSSLAGAGAVTLGSNTLTIGNTDNVPSTFSGVISDGGPDNPGSIIKTGGGTLTLTGNNTYSGGTTLAAGAIALNPAVATNTVLGTGPVTVSGSSGISVGGASLSQTVGDLSINSSTLAVNSSDATGSPYSLALAGNTGVTTLTGSPTFVVNNSIGGGAARWPWVR